jgi:hypothetical protein
MSWWDDIPDEMLGDHPPIDASVVRPKKEAKDDENE